MNCIRPTFQHSCTLVRLVQYKKKNSLIYIFLRLPFKKLLVGIRLTNLTNFLILKSFIIISFLGDCSCPMCQITILEKKYPDPSDPISKVHMIKLFFNIFIYLAVPGRSCGLWDLVCRPGIKPITPTVEAQS